MTAIETVALPDDYFVKSVFQAYSNPCQALFRELLQNSVDAGATQVDFTLNADHLSCEDNGIGMPEEIIRPALLTLTGTFKRADAIGGFGSAKEIILFSQNRYQIHTLDTFVEGSKLQYALSKTQPRVGTKITLFPHARYEYSVIKFYTIAQEYLKMCDTSAVITLNGTVVPPLKVERTAKTLPWGRIQIKQLRGTSVDSALIRAKGVMMFSRYVGTTKKLVVVEVDKPSIELFTSNRDSFNYGGARAFDEIMVELAIDKESFGRKTGEQGVIKGVENFYLLLRTAPARVAKLVELVRSYETHAVANEFELRLNNLLSNERSNGSQVNELISGTIRRIERLGDSSVANAIRETMVPSPEEEKRLPVDFVIEHGNYTPDTLPIYYHPNSMGKRLQLLAAYWKEAVARCLKIESEGQPIRFRVGWTLSEDRDASHEEDRATSIHTILLNPTLDVWKTGSRNYLPRLLALAAHETVHAKGYEYHDERFAKEYTDLTAKLLANRDIIREVKRAVDAEGSLETDA